MRRSSESFISPSPAAAAAAHLSKIKVFDSYIAGEGSLVRITAAPVVPTLGAVADSVTAVNLPPAAAAA